MSDPDYYFRRKPGTLPAEYRATADALVFRDQDRERSLSYKDIRKIRVYRALGVFENPPYLACVIEPRSGPKVTLSNYHFGGDGLLEDRADPYRSFERALFERAAKSNPAIAFVRGGESAAWTMAVLLVLLAVFLLLVAYFLSAALFDGSAVRDLGITLVIGLLLILIAIPAVRQLKRRWQQPFDPLAPNE